MISKKIDGEWYRKDEDGRPIWHKFTEDDYKEKIKELTDKGPYFDDAGKHIPNWQMGMINHSSEGE